MTVTPRVAVLASLLVAAVVYVGILWNGFVYDDNWTFTRREVWEPAWWEVLFARRGVTFTFHRVDRWLWGDVPAGFHATNLLLHTVAAGVVAALSTRLAGSARVGLVAGLVFAVHPVHVDAVASYANRGDVLAMIFVGGAVLLWHARPRRVWHPGLALVFLGVAILAKEASAVGAALMLPLVDVWLRRDEGIPLRRRLLAWAPLLALGAGLTLWFTGDLVPYFQPASIRWFSEGVLSDYGEVLATVLGSLPSAFRLLLFPIQLSFDWPTVPQAGFTSPGALFGLALLVGWLGTAVALARRRPLVGFSMVWVIATYLPSTNVFPIIQYYLAERFLYVPSFGICLLFALAVERLARADRTRVVAVAAVALVVGAGALRTAARTLAWRDERSLAASALAAGVETRRIRHMLGEAAWRDRDYGEAAAHFARCVELEPSVPWLRYDLAAALTMAGRLEEADAEVAAAAAAPTLRIRARRSLYKLAVVSLTRDEPRRAAAQLDHLVGHAPDDARARAALAWVLGATNADALRDPGRAAALLRGLSSPLAERVRRSLARPAGLRLSGPQLARELTAR